MKTRAAGTVAPALRSARCLPDCRPAMRPRLAMAGLVILPAARMDLFEIGDVMALDNPKGACIVRVRDRPCALRGVF